MGIKLDKSARFVGRRAAPTTVALSGWRLLLTRVGWLVVFALAAGLLLASIPAHYDWLVNFAGPDLEPTAVRANLEDIGVSVDFYAAYLLWIGVVSAAVWVAVSAVIFYLRSDDWMALFTSLSLLTFAVFFLNDGPVALAAQRPALWLPTHLLAFFGSVSLGLFFFLFPNGRFVPRWTFWVPALWAVHELAYYFFPDSVFNIDRSAPLLDLLTISTFLGVGAGSQLYRYLRVSDPVQRQQTKWVVFGMTLAVLGVVGFTLPLYVYPSLAQFGSPYAFVMEAGVSASMLMIPLSISVAILRYRLFDIDVLINRALVYGALSASIVTIYALVVGACGLLFQRQDSVPVAVLATSVAAVLFAPLRGRLQRAANRLMYGERDDPYGVLSRLGRRLGAAIEPGTVLPTIVETVAGALKLPYAAISIRRGEGDFEVAAAHGTPTGDETVVPLTYGDETVGRLLLAPRTPGEQFSPADRRLVEDLARNAEVAVYAVRLTDELQRSRERLVTAGEEERRRLRRDLHDGLGPTLASLTLGLDVSLKLLKKSPEDAEEMLSRLKAQTKEAVVDIRRLVYGLRPPALDDLGLVAAVREQAAAHGRLREDADGGTGLGFRVEAPEDLPPLPAAVEVACYRIAQEAITNVARHARATFCLVRFSLEPGKNGLRLEVSDDGVGLPEAASRRSGVGLSSMRERAEELGGELSVTARPEGGTRVSVRFPLPATGAAGGSEGEPPDGERRLASEAGSGEKVRGIDRTTDRTTDRATGAR